jgi:hypothetical protein
MGESRFVKPTIIINPAPKNRIKKAAMLSKVLSRNPSIYKSYPEN